MEHLYQASQIVSGVADCLIRLASNNQSVEYFDAMDLAGRLDLAVEMIRAAGGASI